MPLNPAPVVSINPATLDVVGEVDATPPDQIRSIVGLSRQAFPSWRDQGLSERAAVLKKAQQFMICDADSIARLITLEMGRPFVESVVMELEAGIDLIGYYTDRADSLLGDRRLPLHNPLFKRRKSKIVHQPLGVLGIIAPWNWPLLIPLGCIVPALLAGNAAVFKPSELTPLVGQRIGELFWRAGVPEGVFRIVQGRGDVGEALVASGVDKVFFTGSTEVGQAVMEKASRTLTKVVLEMGGTDPAVVCEDADLDAAASGILWGGMNNCGQNCNAVERVFVNRRVWKEFVERLAAKTAVLKVGDGMAPDTDIGPLASDAQLRKIESLVDRYRKTGTRICAGGERIAGLSGHFYAPTLVASESPSFRPFDEEIFGPVLVLKSVQDDDEAVALSNASEFGLGASVWTSDRRRGERLARRLEAGSVMVNDAVVQFGMTEVNWTGVKKSGVGWVHGQKGMDEMVNVKYVNGEPQFRMQKYWWFPYTPSTVEGINAVVRFLYGTRILDRIRAVPTVLSHFAPYLFFNRKRKDKL